MERDKIIKAVDQCTRLGGCIGCEFHGERPLTFCATTFAKYILEQENAKQIGSESNNPTSQPTDDPLLHRFREPEEEITLEGVVQHLMQSEQYSEIEVVRRPGFFRIEAKT